MTLVTSDLTIKIGAPGFASAVTITAKVIAKLAHKAAFATYGVVGVPVRPIRRVARVFGAQADDGITVTIADGRVDIDLHVVMERGVNLAQVTANVQKQVRYELADIAGLPLGEVRVRVEDVVD